MGREAAAVPGLFADGADVGRLQWEASRLVFRGVARRVFEGAALDGLAVDGADLVLADGSRFTLGVAQAGRWADAIRHPPGRLDKLGVKPGMTTAVINLDDAAFVAELAGRATVSSTFSELDILFYGADTADELARLPTLTPMLADRGALWVVSLKGRQAQIRDVDVLAVARAHGLVDSKVCAFSETRTALRFTRRR